MLVPNKVLTEVAVRLIEVPITVLDTLVPKVVNVFKKHYKNLLYEVRDGFSVKRNDRTGVGCISQFALGINIDIDQYFPILTGKKMYTDAFLSGFQSHKIDLKDFDKGVYIVNLIIDGQSSQQKLIVQ